MEQHSSPKKSFFETYQTFFAIIICGLLIGGGIIVGKIIPTSSGSEKPLQTQDSVRKELLTTAKRLKLDTGLFARCLDTGTNKQSIADAVTLAENSGVTGTPTFFILNRTKKTQWAVLGGRDQGIFEASIQDGIPPAGQPEIKGEKIVLTDTDHYIGPKDAAIVIVEYGDIDCYYCKQVQPTIKKLLADHPEYAFVYRHSPITSLHPFAAYKAEATECAYDQGATSTEQENNFWKLLDIIAQ